MASYNGRFYKEASDLMWVVSFEIWENGIYQTVSDSIDKESAVCGPQLKAVLSLLENKIQSYPHALVGVYGDIPYEFQKITGSDMHDFEITLGEDQNSVELIELTGVAYSIAKSYLDPAGEMVNLPEKEYFTKGSRLLEPGGAYVKFEVVLQKPEIVSEISLTPFTVYPMEIVSIKYEEDIETYHTPKEVLDWKIKKYESTETIVVQLPKSIIAKRFTFIVRQKNYVKNSYFIRESELEKADLWDKITKREATVTLNKNDGIETVETDRINAWTGWDIYLAKLAQHTADFNAYLKEVEAYKAKYDRYLNEVQGINRSWGTSYEATPVANIDLNDRI